jgi:acyl-CoA synthetase (AMP-forming)/AMP-acid ligase II/NADP-dependent 3-hydroxy acid dehydrogenase YdfG/acyl carrier protein
MELNKIVNPKQIEALLSTAPCVQECVVRMRQDSTGALRAVAYIVQREQQALSQLRQQLETLLARDVTGLDCSIVLLASLPLTASGEIDGAALERIPVVDSGLAAQLAAQLNAFSKTDQAAVVLDDYPAPRPALHLSALLPDWACRETDPDALSSISLAENPTPYLTDRTGVAALSNGGDLVLDEATPRLLVDALETAAAQHPENGLVYVQDDGSEITQSYPELYKDALAIASGLAAQGLAPGDRLIFQFDLGQDFIPAFWGCVLGGFVPVPIATACQYSMNDVAVQKLAKAWQMLHKPVVLSSSRIRPELEALAAEAEFHGLSVFSISELRSHGTDSAAVIYRGDADTLAVILLTSGSTGVPKGVVLSHANLLTMALGTAQQNGFSDKDVTLNWMPLEHVGAVSFLQTMAVVLGCKQVHAPTDYVLQKPLIWLDLIEKHRATITWGPNFAFGLLNDLADSIAKHSWDLSSMRFMVSAAEQIVAKTVRQFLRMLAPHGLASNSIHPAFGMSETCSGITWSNRFSLETTSNDIRFVELGEPIPSASIRIVDAENRILDEGEIGRLQLRGPSVTAGYFENPERNREAFTEDGWFDSGDLGFLYAGRLTLTGREKEEIIINGINYAGAEIEAAVEAVAGIELTCTAAVAVRTLDSESDRLAIFFVPGADDDASLLDLLSAVRQQLGTSLGLTPSFLLPLSRADIPKTEIGKIQRKQLRQRFENGDYQNIIRRIDVLSENSNTLPDWFMQQCWVPRQGIPWCAAEPSATTLVFIDDADKTKNLLTRLADHCTQLVCVEPGDGFVQRDENRYQVKIDDADSYKKLLAAVSASGAVITRVLHFWSCNKPDQAEVLPTDSSSSRRSIFSLLGLIQALDQYHAEQKNKVSLLVFSSASQQIKNSDPLDISKAAIGGMLKTAAREFDWLDCRHVDLSGPDVVAQADSVLEEIAITHADQEVAWRDGQRLVMKLARADMSAANANPLAFVHGGLYLISGGLGALGIEVSRYLLNNYAARLLVIGRRQQLDEQRSIILQTLQQLEGEISYHPADISEREAIAAIVAEAESEHNGRLQGVIHLAGSFHQASLLEENPDSFRKALAAKMDGSMVLHQLLAQRGDGVFISFGSVNGFFGGAEFAAYSAGNSFLSGFSQWQNAHTAIRSWCLQWSMWDDMGISHGFAAKEASRAQGFHLLSAEQGMLSFHIGLQHAVPQLFIGLDATRPNIRRHLSEEHPEGEWLQAYVTCVTDAATIANEIRDQIKLTDRFNQPVAYRLSILDEMPLLESGAADKDRLYQLHGQHKAGNNTRVAPRNSFERRIAAIWQDVLGIGEIGIHDNFFGLGGDSLKGAQVMNRLQEDTGVTMHVVALFNAPTVAELALHLGEHYTQDSNNSDAAARITHADEARLREMIHPLRPRTQAVTAGKRRAIFVLSPPRAGSTLLRVMLGGHQQLFAPPELYLLSFNDLADWRETFSGEQTFWHEGMVWALMEINEVDSESAERIIDEHVKQGATSKSFFEQMQTWLGDRVLVDKTPTYALDLEVLRRIEQDFDEVYYIHLQRHPYGVIRSFDEARLDQLLYAFMPNLRSNEGQAFTRLQLAELVWLICNHNILEFLREVPSQRQLALRFEDIVRQPEASMQSVCQFLAIEFDNAMLQPYDKRRARMTEGLHEQSRMLGDLKFHHHKKIDDSVADSWKREYSSDFLGDVTWELARQFGYRSIHEEHAETKPQNSDVIEKVVSEEEDLLARMDGMSDEDIERELEKMLAGNSGV